MKRNNRRWTEEEISLLEEMLEKGATVKKTAKVLERTPAAVVWKKWEMKGGSGQKFAQPKRKRKGTPSLERSTSVHAESIELAIRDLMKAVQSFTKTTGLIVNTSFSVDLNK